MVGDIAVPIAAVPAAVVIAAVVVGGDIAVSYCCYCCC